MEGVKARIVALGAVRAVGAVRTVRKRQREEQHVKANRTFGKPESPRPSASALNRLASSSAAF